MDEMNQAANTAGAEGVANPSGEQGQQSTEVQGNQGAGSSENNQENNQQSNEQNTGNENQTETQRVSQRIKEASARAAQEARDKFIADEGYTWNGKPITTESQYRQALAEQEEFNRRQYLQDNGIDVAFFDKAIEDNPTVKQAKELLAKDQAAKQYEIDWQAFKTEFPDVKPDQIPPEVWTEVNTGRKLIDVYTKHENTRLKAELDAFKTGNGTQQANNQNAGTGTGSMAGKGASGQSYFTQEQVMNMSQAEVNKNYKAIIDSQKSW